MDEQKMEEQNKEELMGNHMTEENMVNEPVITPTENKMEEKENKSKGGFLGLVIIIIILILGGIYLWKMSNKEKINNTIDQVENSINEGIDDLNF